MKKKFLIGLIAFIVLTVMAIVGFIFWAGSVPNHPDKPELRANLEKTYGSFLDALNREDPILLMSVLTKERMQMYDDILKENKKGKFPYDYFKTFKPIMPSLPPIEKFQYIAVTEGNRYANLIYVGNMRGYLRTTHDEEKFLVIQFEKEGSNWKYSVIATPPANMIPNLQERLAKDQLYFLKMKPFKAEKIELIP